MYKEIDKDLYIWVIELLEKYNRRLELIEDNISNQIEKDKNILDKEQIELLIDYLEKIPFKEY